MDTLDNLFLDMERPEKNDKKATTSTIDLLARG